MNRNLVNIIVRCDGRKPVRQVLADDETPLLVPSDVILDDLPTVTHRFVGGRVHINSSARLSGHSPGSNILKMERIMMFVLHCGDSLRQILSGEQY